MKARDSVIGNISTSEQVQGGLRALRVMQITHNLEIGGLQRVVVTLCKTIRRDRFESSVLCLRSRGPLEQELQKHGIHVFSLPATSHRPDYFSFLKVARILKQQRIDVVHTHNTQPLMDGGMGALLAGVKTIIHTDHARQFPDKRRYMIAERVLSHFVYRMIGVSEDTSSNLRHYEKISGNRLMTVPNGIESAPFTVPLDPSEVRHRLGASPAGPLIGTVARLSPEKSIEDAMEAFEIVHRKFVDAKFLIVGEGPCEKALREKAHTLRIENAVIFAGRQSDIASIVRSMDIFVLSSSREGLPMALLEAMAGGCPIVAYAVGGVPSAVEHQRSGFLVPPGQKEQMAARICELIDRPELRGAFANRARSIFTKRFSAEPMTRTYERLYMREGGTSYCRHTV